MGEFEAPQKCIRCDLTQQCCLLWLRGAGRGGGGLHRGERDARLFGCLGYNQLQFVAVWLTYVVQYNSACVALKMCVWVVALCGWSATRWCTCNRLRTWGSGGRAYSSIASKMAPLQNFRACFTTDDAKLACVENRLGIACRTSGWLEPSSQPMTVTNANNHINVT